MNRYFGPASRQKQSEIQIETPIGCLCMICEEQIAQGDMGTVNSAGQITHYECEMRAVIGSVGHQLGRCSCFGGKEEDPEGMTRRQAAIAATRLWERRAEAPRYRILRTTRARAIECLNCGAVSYSAEDLKNRYCGRCNSFHQSRALYEGRLLETRMITRGLGADELHRDVPVNSRGFIVTIMPGITERPYAVIFPSEGQAVVMASAAELMDPMQFQLLED